MSAATIATPHPHERSRVANSPLHFVLQGFKQAVGLRVFTFEGVARDHSRTLLTVSADLALSEKYGIRIQELPLLCQTVLEQYQPGTQDRDFLYTEEQMRLHAADAAREAATRRRKPARRHANANARPGTAWRVAPF